MSLEKFERFVDIIINKRLYAAIYTELNDPMEGLYYYHNNINRQDFIDKMKNGKETLRVCSLSKSHKNSLMWSHYANEHKGVVIKLQIDNPEYEVKNISYTGIPNVYDVNEYDISEVIRVLSQKHEVWKYEEEVRAFVRAFRKEDKYMTGINVEEIFLGTRIDNLHKDLIKKLVRVIDNKIIVTSMMKNWFVNP